MEQGILDMEYGSIIWNMVCFSISFFFKILFIFRQRVREGGREGEKHQCVVASHVPPTGDMAHNLGMCPRL